jgi:hypothetical protein
MKSDLKAKTYEEKADEELEQAESEEQVDLILEK